MAPKAKDWRPTGKGSHIYKLGRSQYRFQVQAEGYCSMEYTTLSDAKKLGLAAYQQWKEQANDAAPAAMNQPAAQPAVAAAAAGPARRKRVKRHKASPDASTDGILQLEVQQQSPGVAAAEAVMKACGIKRAQADPPAAQHKRQRHNAPSPAAAAAGAGKQLGTVDTEPGLSDYQEQTPSAATDAATMPLGKPRKQQCKPAAAGVNDVGGHEQPGKPARKKRGRQAAQLQAAVPDRGAQALPAAVAAAAAWEQPRDNARPTRRVVRKPAAAQQAEAEAMGVDVPLDAAPQHKQQPARARKARAAPAQGAYAAAETGPRTLRPRCAGAAAAAGRVAAQQQGDDGALQGNQKRRRGQSKQQQQQQDEEAEGQEDQHTHSYDSKPSSYRQPTAAGPAPSSGGLALQQQEEQRMSESAGSNWLVPEALEATAAVGGGLPLRVATGAEGSLLNVWYQGSKRAACEGLNLDLQLQQQLGKGGFGSVYKVLVRATGNNSLAGLKFTGPLSNSLKTLVKQNRTRPRGSRARGPAAAAGSSRGGQTARSRAGSRGGSYGGGSHGGSDGSSDGGTWVPMALKVALSFEQISREMQENFREASVFAANVQQRMREEYEVMTACAASAHILDAFCMGNVWLGGSWRPCILMELSGLGDAERVYIQPASAIGGSAPRGISSVMAQRIVRQAAVALKDLHSMSGHMHLDLKVNNLLVFGSKESPCIKLCDFGCAKKRSDEPRYGPASGTKDWQAPEQMAADAMDGPVAGHLDYCTDSWALGLLVLSLRKGQQPFWWLKQEGRLPSEMPDELRSSLSSNDSPYLCDLPRGSKLTRLEVSFVTTCLASHSSRRPPVKDLLEDAPYLSSRYRGG